MPETIANKASRPPDEECGSVARETLPEWNLGLINDGKLRELIIDLSSFCSFMR
jgi:hypothetical protein